MAGRNSHNAPQKTQPRMIGGPGGRRGPSGPVERAQNTQGALRRLWGYLQRHRLYLGLVIVMVALTTATNLIGPYLMGIAIDDYITVGDLAGLLQVVLLMAGVYAVGALTTWLQSILMVRVAQHTIRDLRHDLFVRLQALSLRFFDAHAHGELMSRLTNDLENINTVLTENVTIFISSLMVVPGVIIAMMALNVWLAVITLVIVPAMAVLTRFVARNTRQGFRDQQSALGMLNGLIEEAIDGVEAVRAYGREDAFIAAFDEANAALRESSIKAQTYAGLLGPLGNVVNNAGFALIAGAGGLLVVSGRASVGNLASFLNYAQQLRRPINGISNLFNTIQSALAGAERVFEILDETPELQDMPDALPLEAVRGAVVFEDVSFGYEPDVPVLKHVNLDARPGQTVALVGPTGAGKTTIINLLSRFYDIDAGSICIDGHDIRAVKKADLRRQLGIVLQDTYLFSDTVMENIRYGRLDATDDDVKAAARLANADHFIRRLPHGYATVLSERADNLSQGQRQLLAIARAVLADPGILILDEATSSVDTRTEKQIQEALLRLMEGRTAFVIAHRLSTIRDADQILVIDGGEVVETGTHQSLLAAQGFYYRLYMSQFKGQAASA